MLSISIVVNNLSWGREPKAPSIKALFISLPPLSHSSSFSSSSSSTSYIMKISLVILSVFLALASAQRKNYVDSRNAAILQEARYLSGDGQFGSAYVQDDGTEFKEETDHEGTRKGQYSYYDPEGKKITVHYTAGKNGFEVTGDHLPKAPQPQAAPQPQQQPAPQYQPQPQYNTIPHQQQQQYYQPQQDYNNKNQQQSPQQFSYSFGSDQQQQQQQFAHQQPQQNFQRLNNYQQQQFATTTTTQAPNRFFPPGKLNLNRTPDGFQYSFQSS